MKIAVLRPRYRWVTASMLVLAVLSSAITIKDEAAAERAAPQSSINARLRPTATVNYSSSHTAQARMLEAYGKLPLSFEVNQGQSDRRVRFLSRGSGYSLFLTGNEAVLTLHKNNPRSKSGEQGRHRFPIGRLQPAAFKAGSTVQQREGTSAAVVRMRLVGANGKAKITGLEELPGTSNYFIGTDPTKWHTNLPNYAQVKYATVYPGVDLVYYGNQRQLEYDFVLQPGADPRQIELRFDGAKRLRLDADGDLVISIAGGEIFEHKPIIYQELGGIRRQVGGGYALKDDHAVGFRLAAYDVHQSLTIDPILAYSTFLGGNNYDSGEGIAVDAAGNAYITGYTVSSDFPVTSGAFQTTWGGGDDAFVSKLNPNGSALAYSTPASRILSTFRSLQERHPEFAISVMLQLHEFYQLSDHCRGVSDHIKNRRCRRLCQQVQLCRHRLLQLWRQPADRL